MFPHIEQYKYKFQNKSYVISASVSLNLLFPWQNQNVAILFFLAYIYSWPTVVESSPKALFSIATTPKFRGGGATPFPGLLH